MPFVIFKYFVMLPLLLPQADLAGTGTQGLSRYRTRTCTLIYQTQQGYKRNPSGLEGRATVPCLFISRSLLIYIPGGCGQTRRLTCLSLKLADLSRKKWPLTYLPDQLGKWNMVIPGKGLCVMWRHRQMQIYKRWPYYPNASTRFDFGMVGPLPSQCYFDNWVMGTELQDASSWCGVTVLQIIKWTFLENKTLSLQSRCFCKAPVLWLWNPRENCFAVFLKLETYFYAGWDFQNEIWPLFLAFFLLPCPNICLFAFILFSPGCFQ